MVRFPSTKLVIHFFQRASLNKKTKLSGCLANYINFLSFLCLVTFSLLNCSSRKTSYGMSLRSFRETRGQQRNNNNNALSYFSAALQIESVLPFCEIIRY